MTKEEMLEDARKTLLTLWKEMFTELDSLGNQGYFTPSLLVSKIRDYNRKWNKNPKEYYLPDGFKIFAKSQLVNNEDFGADFITALKYL